MTNTEKILRLMRDRQQWAFKDDRPFWKEAADVWERSMVVEASMASAHRVSLDVPDALLVDLFYAAQSNITEFRIRARALLTQKEA